MEFLLTLPGSASPQWYWRAASLGKPQPHPGEIPTASAGANPVLQHLQRTSQDSASDLASSPRNDLGLDSGSSDQNAVDRVIEEVPHPGLCTEKMLMVSLQQKDGR